MRKDDGVGLELRAVSAAMRQRCNGDKDTKKDAKKHQFFDFCLGASGIFVTHLDRAAVKSSRERFL